MELDFRAFAFIITLAAVINGMGIVRVLASFAEYLRQQDKLEVVPYWVFNLWIFFQFMLHIVMWWQLWNAREVEIFTFLHYLYLLCGPVLLYLGTSLLVPDVENHAINLRKHFYKVRPAYFTIAAFLWLWAIFLFPVLTGRFAPTVPVLVSFLAIALTLRFTANPKIHATLVIASWFVLIIFVTNFTMQLGGVAAAVNSGA
jgi:hypothetical protein